MTVERLTAPFPWFGGKRKAAHLVWARFGVVKNYVEPFFGSGAVLLGRSGPIGTETVNDLDGYVANFWRAIQHDPDAVFSFADNPVNENDLHARHVWLVAQAEDLRQRLEGDPEFYDAKIAGWWVWGISTWIGSGFCSGRGPWGVKDRKLVNLRNAGQGVNRQLVHLGSAGQGEHDNGLKVWFQRLSDRLRLVRVASGDWTRVCGPSVTFTHGVTGVFLDPPYADTAKRARDLYRKDCESVAHSVREWAIANGSNPKLRIALCGYEGEHEMPSDWAVVAWNAGQGYSSQAKGAPSLNGRRERIWFSPHCLSPEAGTEEIESAQETDMNEPRVSFDGLRLYEPDLPLRAQPVPLESLVKAGTGHAAVNQFLCALYVRGRVSAAGVLTATKKSPPEARSRILRVLSWLSAGHYAEYGWLLETSIGQTAETTFVHLTRWTPNEGGLMPGPVTQKKAPPPAAPKKAPTPAVKMAVKTPAAPAAKTPAKPQAGPPPAVTATVLQSDIRAVGAKVAGLAEKLDALAAKVDALAETCTAIHEIASTPATPSGEEAEAPSEDAAPEGDGGEYQEEGVEGEAATEEAPAEDNTVDALFPDGE